MSHKLEIYAAYCPYPGSESCRPWATSNGFVEIVGDSARAHPSSSEQRRANGVAA